MSNTFESFPQSDDQLDDMRDLKDKAYDLEHCINTADSLPRYRALAQTHLEIAVMFANKGIARRELP